MYAVICSGGTGGHIFPGCALYDLLKKSNFEVTLLTDKRGSVFCEDIEDRLILDTFRYSYAHIFSLLKALFCLPFTLVKKWSFRRPDVIIGFGGSMTVIPILIARILGAKVVIYEQNSVVGRANKFLSHFADLKLSFFNLNSEKIEEAPAPIKFASKISKNKGKKLWIVVDPPVRNEFFEARKIPYKISEKIKILIIGGSQGAVSFAKIMPKVLAGIDSEIRKNIEVVQQVSSSNVDDLYKKYHDLGVTADLRPFINNVAQELAVSTLVICRAGASTLSELSVVGRPAILIPYSLASDDHQILNAKFFEQNQAAWVVQENNYVVINLTKVIKNILDNRELLKNASSHIINMLKNNSNEFVKFINKACEQ